jgi:L,D-peptidoglycan transpeptidase YkuD (ErfK/YbiS/YcfS/YnhG family)
MRALAFACLFACGTMPAGSSGSGGGDASGAGGGMQAAGGGSAEVPDAGPQCPDVGDAGDSRWLPIVGCADCAQAWGTDGSALSACDTVKDNYVVVRKSTRNLALCNKGVLVANFRTGLGTHPVGDKEKEGDGKTPEGVFYVASQNPMSTYYKSFLFSYPDSADATRGMASGLISASDQMSIDEAQMSCGVPPQATGLGGLIEIHGDGSSSDWTVGCVALDNANIDKLWSVLTVGDSIVVYP